MNRGFISLLVLIIAMAIIAFLVVKYSGVFINKLENSATSTEYSNSLLAPLDLARQAVSSTVEYGQNMQKIFDQAKNASQAQ